MKNQLPLQMSNLVIAFTVWVLLSSLIPYIKEDIELTPVQLAWVTAIPVLFGSLLRIPVGYLTNRYGARIVFLLSLLILLIPVYLISNADSFIDLIIGGLLLGVGGAVFSIGVTSLPKYYPKERHGLVNGIYSIGNIGTAITAFGAPILAIFIGWENTILLYSVFLIIFIVINFFIGDKHEQKTVISLSEQIRGIYRNEKLWLLCLFYFITYGSFIAFVVYLPNFLVSHFDLSKVDAGLRTAGFIVIATFIRPVGGWLADKRSPFIILMFVFSGLTISAWILSFSPSIAVYTVGCLSVAVFAGIGSGTVFKLVPLYFFKQAGIANGLISAMGGLGGFFPPLLLSITFKITGHYSIGFMAFSQVALASLILVIWMYYQDKTRLITNLVEQTSEDIMTAHR
jgi:NNP family nitrate/nitrite transporter-like MFS transporter